MFFPLVISLGVIALASGRDYQRINSKIVGGTATTIVKHPHQLALQLNNQFDCGASLIAPNMALTVAHCAQIPVSSMYFRSGSSRPLEGGHVIKAAQKCVHPKYKTSSHDYDVAVILLERAFLPGPGTRVIPLQPVHAEINDGTVGTITGWGDIDNEETMASVLQQAHVPKISQQVCRNDYPNKITNRMFCFGYQQHGGIDPCVGDSGGPLVVNGKQVGIITWGEQCGVPHKPGVYTKISNPEIHDFIHYCMKRYESYYV